MAVLGAAGGCGSSSSGSLPKPGPYGGTSSQGEGIGLVVAADAKSLTSLAVQAKYSCPLKASATDSEPRSPSGSVPLKGGSFSGSFTVQGTTYRVSGSYKGGAFSGTLSASFPADVGSGTCVSGSVSWHAAPSSPAPSTSSTASASTGSPSVIRQQLATAAATYNAGAATFNARSRVDAKAGNLRAFKADVAAFRNSLFNFDSAVRKIGFPPADQKLASALLEADRVEIADLDTIGSASSGTATVRLYNRAIADNQGVISAERTLYASA